MPEKLPVQKEMEDKQDCKGEAGPIMQGDPLIARNIQKGSEAVPAASSGRQYPLENKPGKERGNKRNQTKYIDQSIDVYLLHAGR